MKTVFLISWLLPLGKFADGAGHKYKKGDRVELWMNKVGPYANPQEAYDYYTLPYCAPENNVPHLFNKAKAGQYLGELLGGHSLRSSGHDLFFAPSESMKEECTTKSLTTAQAEAFSKAVAEHWFYQLYLDDLPVWGMVGEMLGESEVDKSNLHNNNNNNNNNNGHTGDHTTKEEPYVYTERTLTISYNKDRIVKLDLKSEPHSLVKVKPGISLRFSFTFVWEETTAIPYEGRFDRYLDHTFFKHQIHWFSIFNSFMMVLFLTGLVALILLRTLKADYARYSAAAATSTAAPSKEKAEDALENGMAGEETVPLTAPHSTEDSGWKQVHGDVFRAPAHLPLLSALLGTGSQFFVLTLGVIVFAIAGPVHGGDVYEERGSILHAAIVLYALSASVAGYVSGKYYQMYSYRKPSKSTSDSPSIGWQTTMGLTVVLFPTLCITVLAVLNAISFYYGTIHTISFLTILKLFAVWIFVTVPLCILGTLAGRHRIFGGVAKNLKHPFPCRVNAIPRPIPAASDVPWYGRPAVLIPMSGLLPFGSIFIELYYVLTSLWNYKFYHVYGFMLGVYTILIIVTSMTSIISVYFLLNSGENYLWHWVSFFSGGSTAAYVFLYSVYYYYFKTSMYGLLQTSFYFGYTAIIATSLGTLCGTLGHFAAEKFVRKIFQNVKVD